MIEYDITYTYDQLGNRLTRAEAVANTLVEYSYDTNPANRDPNNQTNNNRLLWYVEKSWDPNLLQYVPTRTVNYTYYKSGDASNISIRDAGDVDAGGKQIVRDLALYYVRNGMLALEYQTKWSEDPPPAGQPWAFGNLVAGSMQFVEAREYRYESPRARYASRKLKLVGPGGSPNGDPQNPCFAYDETDVPTWTDYVGDVPFTDYTVVQDGDINNALVTTQTRHFLQSEQPTSGEKRYFHSDLVGSANLATNETGTPLPAGSGIAKIAYTAFGEEIALPGGTGTGKDAMPTRYRYVGGHGYESDLLVLNGKPGSQPVTLQHVGHRWYQANIGRFVQRDPAGLRAGLNLYTYCGNRPTSVIDPSGQWWHIVIGIIVGAAIGGIANAGNGWGAVGAGIVGGGISGGLSAAGLPIIGGGVGAATSAALQGGSATNVVVSGAVGAAFGAGGKLANRGLTCVEEFMLGVNGELWGGGVISQIVP